MEAANHLKSQKTSLLNAPLPQVTLVENIVERFHQSLVDGDLLPGQEINESQISESLGVARGTLREAIHKLISDGLLEKTPNRRTRVRELSPQKAWEIMTVRAVVESYCARILVERMTPEKAEILNKIWERMESASRASERAIAKQADFQLHQAIVQLSEHELLNDIWSRLKSWILLMFASEVFYPEDLLTNSIHHRQIVDAICNGDPDQAEKQLRSDLLDQNELQRFTDISKFPV